MMCVLVENEARSSGLSARAALIIGIGRLVRCCRPIVRRRLSTSVLAVHL